MPTPSLILATRRSALALQQSNWVKLELEQKFPGLHVELLTIGTTGDRLRHQPLPQIGGKGLFTQELEEALLDGRADFAVHSLKDLPTELGAGLLIAAIPSREDPRDALISRNGNFFDDLPQGARIGTSSVRRSAQLRRLRPDLRIEPLRGNVETRLRKLREGPLDAIVLAAAGLHRMGWRDQITEYFPEQVLYPAIGQGALGIEARAEDAPTLEALAVLEDSWARITTTAERALLRHLGGGCQIPIAAYVHRETTGFSMAAVVVRPDGSEWIQAKEFINTIAIDAAEQLGRATAENLLRQGAKRLLESPA
ncbi:MAG: hydroxymethylbilane synthase [Acidobacteria bacterium]|nr:hydroxymethylbilane synthase [Acidobacteriota bacterium]